MKELQFYGRNRNPEEVVRPRVDTSRNVLDWTTEDEKRIIDNNWSNKSLPSWTNGSIGSLQDTTSGSNYIMSNFAVYMAVTDPETSKALSPYIVKIARSSSLGSALQTADGYFIVQRRGKKVANANLKLDSSASGMINIIDGKLDFMSAIIEKAGRELNLSPEDITDLKYTGLHKSADYETSHVTLTGILRKDLEEIRRNSDPQFTGDSSRIAGVYGVRRENLADYLIDNSGPDGFIDDGIATFMQVLDDEIFFVVAQELARRGRNIRFGDLVNGSFIGNEELEERLKDRL